MIFGKVALENITVWNEPQVLELEQNQFEITQENAQKWFVFRYEISEDYPERSIKINVWKSFSDKTYISTFYSGEPEKEIQKTDDGTVAEVDIEQGGSYLWIYVYCDCTDEDAHYDSSEDIVLTDVTNA